MTEGIDQGKLLLVKIESRARVWGVLIFSVLVWLLIGIVTYNIEGPGFALFVVATVICFFDVFYDNNDRTLGENLTGEDLIILNDEKAAASGASDFWRVLNEVAGLSGVSGENVVGIVRHSPQYLGRAFKIRIQNNAA